MLDLGIYLTYFTIGGLLAWRWRRERRDEDAVFWFSERAAGWPFFALAHLIAWARRRSGR